MAERSTKRAADDAGQEAEGKYSKRRKPVREAAMLVLGELEKVVKSNDEAKYSDRAWMSKACGERLRTFAAMTWIPGRSSPEALAREGWRSDGNGLVVCDLCNMCCKPEEARHAPLCLWHEAGLPPSIWRESIQNQDESSFECFLCAQQIESDGSIPEKKLHRWYCPWRSCREVFTSSTDFLNIAKERQESQDENDHRKRSAALRARVAASLSMLNQ